MAGTGGGGGGGGKKSVNDLNKLIKESEDMVKVLEARAAKDTRAQARAFASKYGSTVFLACSLFVVLAGRNTTKMTQQVRRPLGAGINSLKCRRWGAGSWMQAQRIWRLQAAQSRACILPVLSLCCAALLLLPYEPRLSSAAKHLSGTGGWSTEPWPAVRAVRAVICCAHAEGAGGVGAGAAEADGGAESVRGAGLLLKKGRPVNTWLALSERPVLQQRTPRRPPPAGTRPPSPWPCPARSRAAAPRRAPANPAAWFTLGFRPAQVARAAAHCPDEHRGADEAGGGGGGGRGAAPG